MQAMQPKLKEIQKKYKGNKPKLQEETMKLYKEAGVNPLGGCLPLLLQFPILIAMYAVIRMPMLEAVPTRLEDPPVLRRPQQPPTGGQHLCSRTSSPTRTPGCSSWTCSAPRPSRAIPTSVLKDTSKNPVVSGAASINGRNRSTTSRLPTP